MRESSIFKKRNIRIAISVLFILVITGAFLGYQFVEHEKNQNTRIASLEEQISILNERVKLASTKQVNWLDNGYNYLAIGNSITLHGITSYWWNEIGMAASDADHDYFHIVSSYLESQNPQFMSLPFNFSVWETQSHDRNETLSLLDPYLSTELDLITIQLAENALNLTTYETDYVSLIHYIKKAAPNARIFVIGDFWTNENRNALKVNAINATGTEYVSLDGIADNTDYYCGLGTIVYDKDGNEHAVEHAGVAIHPGDKGMQAIADRIIEALQVLSR